MRVLLLWRPRKLKISEARAWILKSLSSPFGGGKSMFIFVWQRL
jgi:hypothetical protein